MAIKTSAGKAYATLFKALAVVRANEMMPPANFQSTFTVEVGAAAIDRLRDFPTWLSQFRTRATRSLHAFERSIQQHRSKQRGPHNPDTVTNHTRSAWQFAAISGNNPASVLSGSCEYRHPAESNHLEFRIFKSRLRNQHEIALL
jgi:hypothetical protein